MKVTHILEYEMTKSRIQILAEQWTIRDVFRVNTVMRMANPEYQEA